MRRHGRTQPVLPRTLVDILRRRADDPDARGYVFLIDGETEERRLGFVDLDREARRIAAALQGVAAAGDRALLLYPPGLDFIAGFFGCLYAGVAAVPAYPPDPAALERSLARVRAIARDSQARLVLTTREVLALRDPVLGAAPELAALRWIAADGPEVGDTDAWRPPAIGPETTALLQYTSGSTGFPRGVVLTHRNLIHNEWLMETGFGTTPEDIVVGWLPLYHDMGLIGNVLHPLYRNNRCVLMSPVAFIQRPIRWLAAISRHRATISGGPNFAYDLCVRKTTPAERAALDLGSWSMAFCGAEPVRKDTLERFAAAFAPSGFRWESFSPCYGLAEGTLIAAGLARSRPPLLAAFARPELECGEVRPRPVDDPGAQPLVGCGPVLGDQTIRIVDRATLRPCPRGRVGEIWVSGPSVARGYWNRPTESASGLGARIGRRRRTFLRTGDLGFFHEGQLFVTARAKDVVIVRGRNLAPQDIEATVEQSHPALRPGCGAAFSVDVGSEERPVVVQEIDSRCRMQAGEALAAIRRAVAREHGVQPAAIVLLPARTIPKTSSGKIQRHACRAAFSAGTLEAVAEWRPSAPAGDEAARPAPADPAPGSTIAIVGMACRFPGASDPERFWALLESGGDAVGLVPRDRWMADALYDPNPAAPGKMVTRWGGFLDDLGGFDARFFGILPGEAAEMDPQQRLLLEVAWEALERAGLPPDRMAGTAAGVFVGIGSSDYLQSKILAPNHLAAFTAHSGTGNAHSVAPNRLSYVLDLRGPSLAIDTACSSSLVAVHLACRSLRSRECNLALAGGVNLVLRPETTVAFSRARMMAPDGRCKSFDAAADGYVRAEGCGLVVLKRLEDARRDGDPIVALIRGSAVNQDGRTPGLTVPSGEAQQAVIRAALADAAVAPGEVGFVEAHGTGTALGDPVEIAALAAVLGTTGERPCIVGSVKPNVGHLECASGIAGLMKAVLCLEHGEIPPQVHLRTLNPRCALEGTRLEIPTAVRPWPADGARRIAGVNSFGFGGTNAHVVLEEAPSDPAPPAVADRPLHLLALSARTEQALTRLAERFAEQLGREPAALLSDVCHSANVGRARHAVRMAVRAGTTRDLARALRAFAAGRRVSGLVAGAAGEGRPKVAFLFTGQGAQRVGMGRTLYETQPTFRQSLEKCAAALRDALPRPLLSVLFGDSEAAPLLDDTRFTQPALFALEFALVELLASWGVVPDVVLGHSIGEYVAAAAAGVFDLAEAAALVATRGRLMAELPRDGAMAAVLAGEAEVASIIAELRPAVAVAAVNGPQNTVISGPRPAVMQASARLESQGLAVRPLAVSQAFHSPLLEPMLDAFEAAASRVAYAAPRIPLVSNVTGRPLGPGRVPDAAYWRCQARAPVRFADGIRGLWEDGYRVFVEVGPKPVLCKLARRCVPNQAGASWLPALRGGPDEWSPLLEMLGALYVRGVDVDWAGFDRDYPRRRVVLPTYPFERTRHWHAVSAAPDAEAAPTPGHGLLGARLRSALPTIQFETRLGTGALAYLHHHRVQGAAIVPAAAYFALLHAAAREVFGGRPLSLLDARIHAPLSLPDGRTVSVQVAVAPPAAGETLVQVFAPGTDDERAWTQHASATARLDPPASGVGEPPEAVRARSSGELSGEELYGRLGECGLDYGPAFRRIAHVWFRSGEALGRLAPADPSEGEEASPAVLDAALHVLAAAAGGLDRAQATYVPVAAERVTIHRPPREASWSHAVLRSTASPEEWLGDVRLLDADGQPVVAIDALALRRVAGAAAADAPSDSVYELCWEPEPRPPSSPGSRGCWLVFADEGGLGARLGDLLRADGHTVLVASRGAGYAAHGGGRYVIDPSREEDLERLLRACERAGGPTAVIHLWSLDAAAAADLTGAALEAARRVGCEHVLRLVQGLRRAAVAPALFLVTRGTHATAACERDVSLAQAPLWGFGRVLALEHPELRCVLIDLAPAGGPDDAEILRDELLAAGGGREVALRTDGRYVPRLRPAGTHAARAEGCLAVPEADAFVLRATRPGHLGGLALAPVAREAPGPGLVEIEVETAGLNFRDVMCALGLYPEGPVPLGAECAGRISALGRGVREFKLGDPVLAIAPGSFGRFAVTAAALVAPKPETLSFEEAATVPIAFSTAYYALVRVGRLRRGERVLVHAAAGGVGLAAVQLALSTGAEVFATAGTEEKRAYLASLGVAHVMDSRSLDFADQVLAETAGVGVDVVLNSLGGPFIPRSLSVLRAFGRFLEIGKTDIYSNSPLGLFPFRNNLSYHAIDLERVCRQRAAVVRAILRDVIRRIASGELRPLPRRAFRLDEAPQAFRHVAQRRSLGKVILTVPKRAATTTALMRADATYLVTGGTGGLGLALARWLVDRGARHLVLAARGAPGSEASAAVRALEGEGVRVRVAAVDVSRAEEVETLVTEMRRTMPPLGGVVHAAGVLDDAPLCELTAARLAAVMAPKVEGAWNLHRATLEERLDFFVCCSSLASLLGSLGQANYAAGNAFLDALAHHRRAHGLPATTINWGPWAAVGMATRDDRGRYLALAGLALLPVATALATLDRLLLGDRAQVAVALADWRKLRRLLRESPLLAALAPGPAGPADGRGAVGLRERLSAADPADRARVVVEHLTGALARLLGVRPGDLAPDEPITNFGLDSLAAIELRDTVETALGVTLSLERLMDEPTIARLADGVLAQMAASPAATDASGGPS